MATSRPKSYIFPSDSLLFYNPQEQSAPARELEVQNISMYTRKSTYDTGRVVASSSDFIAYAVRQGMVRLISQEYGTSSLIRDGLQSETLDMAFSPISSENSNFLAACSLDGRVCIWKISAGDPAHTGSEATTTPQSATSSPSSSSSGNDGPPPRSELICDFYHPRSKQGASFSRLAWHPKSSDILGLTGPGSEITVLVISTLLAKNRSSAPLIEDLTEAVFHLEGATGLVTTLAFAPTFPALKLAVGGTDGYVRIWNLILGSSPSLASQTLCHEGETVFSVSWLSSNVLVTGGDRNSELRLWAMQSSTSGLNLCQTLAFTNSPTLSTPPLAPEQRRRLDYRGPDSFLNHFSLLPLPAVEGASILLVPNAKQNSLYVIQLNFGGNSASFVRLTEFTLGQPVLSFSAQVGEVSTQDSQPRLELYCAHPKAVQLYQIVQSWVLGSLDYINPAPSDTPAPSKSPKDSSKGQTTPPSSNQAPPIKLTAEALLQASLPTSTITSTTTATSTNSTSSTTTTSSRRSSKSSSGTQNSGTTAPGAAPAGPKSVTFTDRPDKAVKFSSFVSVDREDDEDPSASTAQPPASNKTETSSGGRKSSDGSRRQLGRSPSASPPPHPDLALDAGVKRSPKSHPQSAETTVTPLDLSGGGYFGSSTGVLGSTPVSLGVSNLPSLHDSLTQSISSTARVGVPPSVPFLASSSRPQSFPSDSPVNSDSSLLDTDANGSPNSNSELKRMESHLLARFDRMLQLHADRQAQRVEKEREQRERSMRDASTAQLAQLQATLEHISNRLASQPAALPPRSGVSEQDLAQLLRPIITETFRQSLERLILPKFEAAISELCNQVRTSLDQALRQQTSEISTATRAMSSACSELTQIQTRLSTLAQQLAGSSSSGGAPSSDSASGPSSSGNGQPLKPPPRDLRPELIQLISQRNFMQAFTLALNAENLSLVVWLCSQVDLSQLLSSPPLLDPPVQLSLIQQLAFDLTSDTASKLQWLQLGELFSRSL